MLTVARKMTTWEAEWRPARTRSSAFWGAPCTFECQFIKTKRHGCCQVHAQRMSALRKKWHYHWLACVQRCVHISAGAYTGVRASTFAACTCGYGLCLYVCVHVCACMWAYVHARGCVCVSVETYANNADVLEIIGRIPKAFGDRLRMQYHDWQARNRRQPKWPINRIQL